jgi:predicted CXXCH cytochrome family protein
LQFDPETPELQLPHGEVEFVKAFLGSLKLQYENYAQTTLKITESRALKNYVDTQMRRLEERRLIGSNLEDDIFLSRSRKQAPTGHVVPFYGCAYCHEVTGRENNIQVVKAEVPLRWLTKGAFHHREHRNTECIFCHDARVSAKTSDILLPSVKVCARCHRSNAAPGETCMLCHTYHHWRDQLQTMTGTEVTATAGPTTTTAK